MKSRTIKRRYDAQRYRAKQRGVPFLLTYEQWLEIWISSGKWLERGSLMHQYCMARNDDIGGYEVGNVTIKTCFENNREQERDPIFNRYCKR